jgi:hypothetical protein
VKGDIFENFAWHSSIGIDSAIDGNKQFVTRLPNTAKARRSFVASGDSLLIHRTTKSLWKVSDDKKSIEPVFATDVLTEDQVKQAMEDDE